MPRAICFAAFVVIAAFMELAMVLHEVFSPLISTDILKEKNNMNLTFGIGGDLAQGREKACLVQSFIQILTFLILKIIHLAIDKYEKE